MVYQTLCGWSSSGVTGAPSGGLTLAQRLELIPSVEVAPVSGAAKGSLAMLESVALGV